MTYKYGDFVALLNSFKSENPEHLTCKKGEKLTILCATDENWIKCLNAKRQEGLVPLNLVKIYKLPIMDELWYHGELTRSQAEHRLSNADDGTFLVRSSDKYPGDFSLCVMCENNVEFYHVNHTEKGYSLDEERWFESMATLISHYQKSSDGLCCALTKYCENTLKPQLDYLKKKELFINDFELNITTKIGSGEFCEVFLAMYRGTQVAVKCFKRENNLVAENLFTFESSLMAKLNHPNLVTFIGMSVTQDHIFLVTEYMEVGSLLHYLQSRGSAVIKTVNKIKFAIDCCLGMCYLEKHCLVHRDLAARNILLNNDLVAKVSDFGLTKFDTARLPSNDANKSCAKVHEGKNVCNLLSELVSLSVSLANDIDSAATRIPVKWTAPEALTDNKYTNKSDVWSFGVLLWEIFSFGRVPYPKIAAHNVRQYILDGYRMDPPIDTPKNIGQLMNMCWAANPDHRPNFESIHTILTRD